MPQAQERQLVYLRWGLIPAWSDDPSIGDRLANARSETAVFVKGLAFQLSRAFTGPHDGSREAATILRGRLECRGGVYEHVLDGDPITLYWVPEASWTATLRS